MDQGLPQGLPQCLPHQYLDNIELFYLFTLLTELESGSEVLQTSAGSCFLRNSAGRSFFCIKLLHFAGGGMLDKGKFDL